MNPTGKGGFKKGVSGNPAGRKRRASEEEVMVLFRRVVKTEDREKIIDDAIARAKRGDTSARKFIFDYLYGPPVERHEHTGEDGSPMRILVTYDNDEEREE